MRLVALAALAASVLARPALAQDRCDDLVDNFGIADADRLLERIDAAEEATDTDFFVYITDVIVADYLDGEEGADALEDEAQSACPRGFDGPGDPSNSVVVIAVSVGDALSVISYGDDLADDVTFAEAETIRADMGPFFRDADYGGGVAEGVEAFERELRQDDSGATGQSTGSDSGTSGSGSSGIPLGVVGGIGGVGVLGAGGAYAWSRRSRLLKARAALRARYEKADADVAAVQSQWYDAEQEATLFRTRYAGGSVDQITLAQSQALVASDALADGWSPLQDLQASAIDDFDSERLEELTTTLDATDQLLADAKTQTGELVSVTKVLGDRDDEIVGRKQVVGQSIEAARSTVSEVGASGWNTDAASQRLDELSTELAGIDLEALPLDVVALSGAIDEVETDVTELTDFVGSLDERHAEAVEGRHRARVEYDTHRRRITELGGRIEAWRRDHARASFEAFEDHPGLATSHLDGIEARLVEVEAVGELAKDTGALRSMFRELEVIDAGLEEADDLLDDADDLDVTLASVKTEAPRLVEEAAESVAELATFRATHAGELTPSDATAEGRLRNAQEALRETPPNYAFAAGFARDAIEDADSSLQEARAEVLQAQAERRAAQAAVREAALAIDRADRHVKDHMFASAWDRETSNQLDQLRRSLASVQQQAATDGRGATAMADAIEDQANAVYDEARRRQRQTSRGGGGVIFGGGRGGGGFGGGGYRRRPTSRGGGFGMGSSSSRRSSGSSRSSRSSSSSRRSSGGGRRSGRRGSGGHW